MKNRLFLVAMVCLAVCIFSMSMVLASPGYGKNDDTMYSDNAMMHNDMIRKNIMMAADRFLKMSPDMGFYRVDVRDLKTKVDSDAMDFVIIDVRPADAFTMEHIPMAMNVPLPMVIDQLSMMPVDKTIYVVCAVDSNSSYATAVLRMLGYNAYMVPGGHEAWKTMGYPLTVNIQ